MTSTGLSETIATAAIVAAVVTALSRVPALVDFLAILGG